MHLPQVLGRTVTGLPSSSGGQQTHGGAKSWSEATELLPAGRGGPGWCCSGLQIQLSTPRRSPELLRSTSRRLSVPRSLGLGVRGPNT